MEAARQMRDSDFVVCVKNEGHEVDLEPLKIYEVVPDESLEPGDIRVIDESGEDYIYPVEYFMFLEVMERRRLSALIREARAVEAS